MTGTMRWMAGKAEVSEDWGKRVLSSAWQGKVDALPG